MSLVLTYLNIFIYPDVAYSKSLKKKRDKKPKIWDRSVIFWSVIKKLKWWVWSYRSAYISKRQFWIEMCNPTLHIELKVLKVVCHRKTSVFVKFLIPSPFFFFTSDIKKEKAWGDKWSRDTRTASLPLSLWVSCRVPHVKCSFYTHKTD
jgi:hypothetical protein